MEKIAAGEDNYSFPYTLLAGDLGGTNTTLALLKYNPGDGREIEEKKNPFIILYKKRWSTQKIDDFALPFSSILEEVKKDDPSLLPSACCLSAAGPVKDNRCNLTNASWTVDGNDLSARFQFPVQVINDFSALSYSLPLLDISDLQQISPISHTDGSQPTPQRATRAVIGAGTGMGFGFLMEERGKYIAGQSEGGHIDFAAFDEETWEFARFNAKRLGVHPGSEPCISGRGIASIFEFFLEQGKLNCNDGRVREIQEVPREKKPALISKYAREHEGCANVMRFFVKLYGKYAGNASLILLPYGGLFLAGGIVSKNEAFFLEESTFMRYFEENYNPRMKPILKGIPVYIIREYETSLFGAAHAAHLSIAL